MNEQMSRSIYIVLAILFISQSSLAAEPLPFSGDKTAWHGFDRFDFLMDEESLAVKPTVAGAEEKNGVRNSEKGQRRCLVVAPKVAAPGNPWSWQGWYWDHEA